MPQLPKLESFLQPVNFNEEAIIRDERKVVIYRGLLVDFIFDKENKKTRMFNEYKDMLVYAFKINTYRDVRGVKQFEYKIDLQKDV